MEQPSVETEPVKDEPQPAVITPDITIGKPVTPQNEPVDKDTVFGHPTPLTVPASVNAVACDSPDVKEEEEGQATSGLSNHVCNEPKVCVEIVEIVVESDEPSRDVESLPSSEKKEVVKPEAVEIPGEVTVVDLAKEKDSLQDVTEHPSSEIVLSRPISPSPSSSVDTPAVSSSVAPALSDEKLSEQTSKLTGAVHRLSSEDRVWVSEKMEMLSGLLFSPGVLPSHEALKEFESFFAEFKVKTGVDVDVGPIVARLKTRDGQTMEEPGPNRKRRLDEEDDRGPVEVENASRAGDEGGERPAKRVCEDGKRQKVEDIDLMPYSAEEKKDLLDKKWSIWRKPKTDEERLVAVRSCWGGNPSHEDR